METFIGVKFCTYTHVFYHGFSAGGIVGFDKIVNVFYF